MGLISSLVNAERVEGYTGLTLVIVEECNCFLFCRKVRRTAVRTVGMVGLETSGCISITGPRKPPLAGSRAEAASRSGNTEALDGHDMSRLQMHLESHLDKSPLVPL